MDKTDADYYGEPEPKIEEPEDMAEPEPAKTDADYYGEKEPKTDTDYYAEPEPDLPEEHEKTGWVEKAKSYIPRVSHLGTSKGHGRKAKKAKVSAGPSLQALGSGPSIASSTPSFGALGTGPNMGAWGKPKKAKKRKGPSVNFSGAAFGSWGAKKIKSSKASPFQALTSSGKPKGKKGRKAAKAAKPKGPSFAALGTGPKMGMWGKPRKAKKLRF